jgi:hypothetical protein
MATTKRHENIQGWQQTRELARFVCDVSKADSRLTTRAVCIILSVMMMQS